MQSAFVISTIVINTASSNAYRNQRHCLSIACLACNFFRSYLFLFQANIYRKSLVWRHLVNKYLFQTHALCALIILLGARYCEPLAWQIATQPRKINTWFS